MTLRSSAFAVSSVIAILCSTVTPAHAWSARGHAMVGDIAAQFLTPAASQQVTELLQGDLLADGKPSNRKTLAAVASWPDELRLTPEQKATGVYHYDDVPFCTAPDYAVYCKDGKCASAWFDKQVAILKDRSQPQRARNEALKWIVHIVGDVHQPLHASDHDDRGGNDVEVTWLGKRGDDPVEGRTTYPYNLHSAWDRLIPYRMLDERGGSAAFLAERPSDETRRDWEVGTFRQWVAEGTDLAKEFIYPNLPKPGGTMLKVTVEQRGATPEAIDKDVTAPIAKAISTIPGVTFVRASSKGGVSQTSVEAASGTDPSAAVALVRARIEALRPSFPAGAGVPSVGLDAKDDDISAFACEQHQTKLRALDESYYRPAAVIAAEQLKKAGVRLAKVLNDALGEP